MSLPTSQDAQPPYNEAAANGFPAAYNPKAPAKVEWSTALCDCFSFDVLFCLRLHNVVVSMHHVWSDCRDCWQGINV